jgi:signal transduction histidine kinase
VPAVHRLRVISPPFAALAREGQWRDLVRQLCDPAVQAAARARLSGRFEERLRERERIARELHDTLLQGTQSLILSMQALQSRTPPEDPLHDALARSLRRAQGLMTEGLERIQNLRQGGDASVDLAQSLATAWRELAGGTGFSIVVEGAPRAIEPGIADEIALIGREALNNALRHASARLIEVQIVHAPDHLLLRVRDDGMGMGTGELRARASPGHWGLQGMRERAQCIRGRLDIWSAPGAGTEIELAVPAAVAYRAGGGRVG